MKSTSSNNLWLKLSMLHKNYILINMWTKTWLLRNYEGYFWNVFRLYSEALQKGLTALIHAHLLLLWGKTFVHSQCCYFSYLSSHSVEEFLGIWVVLCFTVTAWLSKKKVYFPQKSYKSSANPPKKLREKHSHYTFSSMPAYQSCWMKTVEYAAVHVSKPSSCHIT